MSSVFVGFSGFALIPLSSRLSFGLDDPEKLFAISLYSTWFGFTSSSTIWSSSWAMDLF